MRYLDCRGIIELAGGPPRESLDARDLPPFFRASGLALSRPPLRGVVQVGYERAP